MKHVVRLNRSFLIGPFHIFCVKHNIHQPSNDDGQRIPKLGEINYEFVLNIKNGGHYFRLSQVINC